MQPSQDVEYRTYREHDYLFLSNFDGILQAYRILDGDRLRGISHRFAKIAYEKGEW